MSLASKTTDRTGASPDLARIAQYLAGRLPESEAEAFEADCAAREDLRRELELTLQIKEGLAQLRERGRLELNRDSPKSRLVPFGLAAAVAVIAVALLMWSRLEPKRQGTPLLTASPPIATSLSSVPTYRFVSMRDAKAQPIVIAEDAAVIALNIRPDDPSRTSRYRVALKRRGVDAQRTAIAEVGGLTRASDGFVTVYLRSRTLTPGPYLLLVDPTPATDSFGVTEFDIELR